MILQLLLALTTILLYVCAPNCKKDGKGEREER
jgi:hypothetical protein